MNINICYLIQAYSDYNAFKKLCSVLLEDKTCHIFVHLDKKSDINKFMINDSKIHFIEKREFVSWAGYKQGKLILNLIEAAIKYPKKFDYYCFLSESDYPVYEGQFLRERISQTRNVFLNCSKYQPNKIQKYWFFDLNIRSPKINKYISHVINMITEIFYQCGLVRKNNKILINGKMCDVYFSSPFWKYTFNEVSYIHKTFVNNPQIETYFKYSFAPCELIVSTIIANSEYKNEVDYADHYENLNQLSSFCFFRYNGSRVNVLNEKDYDAIIGSQKPFMRKIKKGESDNLLKKLKTYNEKQS